MSSVTLVEFFFISLGHDAEICQIAATDGQEEFNVYVIPQNGITLEASAVNKLTVINEILYHEKKPVKALSLAEALAKFLTWLNKKVPCILLAHNVKTFDAKHLMKALSLCNNMEEFCQTVVGFSDTLPAFRELFPDRRSFSQENLAKDLLDSTYDAHNAPGDVQMLHTLSSQFIGDQLLLRHSFSTSWFQEYTMFLEQKRANLQTFQPLLNSKAVSKGIADKMAASGLQYRHLLLAHQREGNDGVSNVLMEKFEGKRRVTANKRVIRNICMFLHGGGPA